MYTRIPTNYRQSFKWLGNLDAVSAGFLGGGVVIGLSVLTGHGTAGEKIPEIAVALALGAFFGLVRYPMDIAGDRTSTWVMRYVEYRRRTRRYSYFDGLVHLPRRGK